MYVFVVCVAYFVDYHNVTLIRIKEPKLAIFSHQSLHFVIRLLWHLQSKGHDVPSELVERSVSNLQLGN